MPSLFCNGAEPESGSPCTDLEAGHANLNLAGQSPWQLGINIANLIKDGKVTFKHIQSGLNGIQERETMEQEALIQAFDRLSACEAQRIIIELLEKNLVGIVRFLICENDLIKESLKKKLLVEEKDGTFATRKFETDAI
ncbi:uncharacterized protein EAE97_006937 [Botrytis byssoidea]|uniref:Uncharacterized protein n=1 Tax=Botrytis byssoidea TaxID=139641 RepID=A0A9P5M4L8_9HELO|nr:uncharacterized protein EAE97_006937 [Botrytis byssoidea]KAF7940751.1 hypothetical protein EAE97_006937 [Botrytis byssoidea]